jgi:DNA-binding XRE family transcriptional regulator
LADRLVKARHVAGLTQEALARRLGISKKTVVRGEGGGTISRPLLVAWALACRVNVAWLLTGDPGDEAVWADMSPVTLDNQDVPVPLAA